MSLKNNIKQQNEDALFELFKKKKRLTVKELCAATGASKETVESGIEGLLARGVIINLRGGAWVLDKEPAPGANNDFVFVSDKDGRYKFGFYSDQHLGSKYARLDVGEDLYSIFANEGVKHVINAGNWIDGEARFNKHDLLVHGCNEQCQHLAEKYPQRKGITTYAVSGDDHEGWYCFESGTEILTRDRGWVDFSELNNSDFVATKTESGLFEWQIPNKVISKRHSGDMVRLKHRSIDIAVTPDHRFEVLRKSSMHGLHETKIITAGEMLGGFKPRCIGIPRTVGGWTGAAPREIEIPPISTKWESRFGFKNKSSWHPTSLWSHDLAVLVGWYVTEGYIDGNRVVISQSCSANPENHERIKDVFRALGREPVCDKNTVYVSSPELASYIKKNCGSGFENKKVPRWVLDSDSATLKEVFNAMIAGDGNDRGDGGGWKFYTGSRHLEAAIAEIAQKLGFAVSYCNGKGCVNVGIGERHGVAWLFRSPEIEQYDGMVYCVSVHNERIFVRKNGKTLWSMNCQQLGIDIGKYAESVMRENDRKDWVNLGYMECFITLRHRESGKECKVSVMHPGGGSAYAVSYKPQKIAESFSGGDKPAAMFIGHYHKMSYNLTRSIHAIQCGTGEDQTTFMRKKGLDAHVGGGIVDFRQDPRTGALIACRPEFFQYFVKGYYNNRWSHSGGVTHARRM